MKKNYPDTPAKPSVQVLERMFVLIDVLASREEAISLKEISEKKPGCIPPPPIASSTT